jgi:hypothetical protein
VARLRLEQSSREPAIPRDPNSSGAGTLPCLSIALGRTKTGSADEETRVLLIGPPVEALDAWIAKAGIEKGAVFRAIDRWGNLEDTALTPQAVTSSSSDAASRPDSILTPLAPTGCAPGF